MLVEDCLKLTLRSFGKEWTRIKRGEKVQGEAQITPRLGLSYWTENNNGEIQLVVALGMETQTIALSTSELTYGTRFSFLCSCGRGCDTLYLPRGHKTLACAKCSHLYYESSRINRHSSIGRVLYQARWIDKAIRLEELIGKRKIYNNNLTRRFRSFVSAAKKAGIHEAVEQANTLVSLMRARSHNS